MTLTKKIALAVSAAVVFAGGTRCAFNAFSPSRASQVSRAVPAPPPGQAIRQGVQVPLTQRPGPPPYTIQITPHDAGMSGSRTTQHDPAFYKIVSLSVSEIITSSFAFDQNAAYLISDVDLGKECYDFSLNLVSPGPNFPQESSQYAWRPLAQREIESAWNLSLRKEKRNVDALILRAPAGKPASLRPGTGNGSYFQHKGSTTQFHKSAIRALCTAMEQITLKPVVDETGITGKFDFEMDSPSNEEKAIKAVKKLGFDLAPEKRDIEMIIVAPANP